MIKRIPKLYANQLSKFKYDNSIPTSELLTKLGIVSYPKSGLVNWSKIGLLIQNKINNIIRKNLDSINFEELSLSLLSNKTNWIKTGRWNQKDIFKLKNDEMLLVPTCEEDITTYVKHNLESYKQLPLKFYQINQKFRDEKRPRGGLLRGKEFLMKDAYSFDLNELKALETYKSIVGSYHKIFNQIGINYVKAQADSGDIGGDLSHEWHYLNENGEDTVFTCNSCGHVSNQEKTIAYPTKNEEINGGDVSVKYFITDDNSTLVCAYYPSNRVLEPNFIKLEVPDINLKTSLTESQILDKFSKESEEDLSKKVVRIMDSRLNSRSNFPDFPINFVNRSMITTLTDIPIVLAESGEICGECEEGHLTKSNAIEIGHTFYLGDKYSKPLDLKIDIPKNDKVETKNIMMGCYGIGISRIIAAIAEINKDEKGLRWPKSITPWEVTIVETNQNPEFKEIYNELENFDYKLDDRNDVSLGKKINQSNLLGIPLVVILGKKYPIVEIEIRGKRIKDKEIKWKHLYDKKDFQWDVEYENGNDIKHYVHKDHLIRVLNSLLKDM
ncbi:PRS [Candida pseudojiufengensis]|uniref:PRS n=1 Tax=Candida pseudojiufengensis TaxID=497109 RepID=UPI002224D2C4|nr:PRS [Candida pseudojiufengensis]KAI5966801.1 PRS [Candida pseudojiufengensis]